MSIKVICPESTNMYVYIISANFTLVKFLHLPLGGAVGSVSSCVVQQVQSIAILMGGVAHTCRTTVIFPSLSLSHTNTPVCDPCQRHPAQPSFNQLLPLISYSFLFLMVNIWRLQSRLPNYGFQL